jgi:hypothetical protein
MTMDITKTIWVTQHDYDSNTNHEVSLSVMDYGIEIDLVGGVGTVVIKRDQFPELCGLLYKEVTGDCGKKD